MTGPYRLLDYPEEIDVTRYIIQHPAVQTRDPFPDSETFTDLRNLPKISRSVELREFADPTSGPSPEVVYQLDIRWAVPGVFRQLCAALHHVGQIPELSSLIPPSIQSCQIVNTICIRCVPKCHRIPDFFGEIGREFQGADFICIR